MSKAWPAYACAAFVFLAVILEFLGGRGGQSVADGASSSITPPSWPTAARVLWWIAVSAAAGGYKALADWIDQRAIRWWLVVLTAAPFLAWTVGIATSQDWANFR